MLDLRRALFRSGVTVGGMLRRLGLDGPRLDPDRLLARAEDLAGCDVWGEPEPRTPLSHLVQDLEREAGLHLPGKIAARFDLLRMLTHRLRIEAAFVRDPGLLAAPITRPLFVVGMPRSGTTALHGLLARDPSRRAPSTWEVLYPIPRKAPTSADANRRRARVARQLPWMDAMSPGFQRGHALEAGEPQECVNITAHSMESFQFQSMYRVPGYQAWLEPRSGVARYRYHRRFLQYLQRFDEPPRRWVLKAPAHLFDLGALLEVYPDAAIVQTHREPFEVVSSLALDYEDRADFVMIEVWEDFDEQRLVPAAAEWIQTETGGNEPWVFLVGADGRVTARWDNVLDVAELIEELEALPVLAS